VGVHAAKKIDFASLKLTPRAPEIKALLGGI